MATCFLRRRHARQVGSGFTIVEMMIAMVLTLIMVYAIAEFYAFVGESVKDGRALIEISGSLRTATQRLKADLEHLTVKVVPPVDDATASGYFCITEGPGNDASPLTGAIDADSDGTPDVGQDSNGNGIADYLETYDISNLLGDIDDIIAFTLRNDVDPFVAPAAVASADGSIFNTPMQTSSVAEVVWWTSFTNNATFGVNATWELGEVRNLHRRLLLVRPDLNQVHPSDPNGNTALPYYVRIDDTSVADLAEAYRQLMQVSDVSVRYLPGAGGDYYFVANSLADLTRRENRFMNVIGAGAFPNILNLNPHNVTSQAQWTLDGARKGEDVILSNILAVDVRVFDPTAVLLADSGGAVTLQPGDPGYNLGVGTFTQLGTGAYVDLNYSRYVPGLGATYPVVTTAYSFYGAPNLKSQFPSTSAVYDTWATSYERDGLNQDWSADATGGYTPAPTSVSQAPFDEGTNGLDDDGINGVDDAGERETLPPYPVPLRGIEVRVRVYEPGTRQAQQATVNADFVAE